MSDWYEEDYHPHWRQRFEVERYIYRGRTRYQEAIIFQSPVLGRVLVLDGIVQTTERDEFIYHEMIAHVAIMAHGRAREVLIIGGGDGGTLEEVLKHRSVVRATMVELDAGVSLAVAAPAEGLVALVLTIGQLENAAHRPGDGPAVVSAHGIRTAFGAGPLALECKRAIPAFHVRESLRV